MDIRPAIQIRMLSMRCVRAIPLPPVARAALHVPGSVLTPVRDALGGAVRDLLGGGERTPDFAFAGVDDPGLPLRNRLALGLWPLPFADPLVVRPATSTMLAVLGWALGPPPTPVFEAA